MSHVIAVAGKGGVGKTTLCGLLIQYLCEQKKGPILAVDADANSNLNEVLGVEVEATLGDIREEIARAETAKENPIPAGVSKADYAEFKFNSALIEDDDFDMLVMGRTQGKGCYCFVNGLLQAQLAKLQNNYPYMVVDNEAGMELIEECDMHPQQIGLIVNRAPNGVLNEGTKEEIEIQGLNLLGVVPQDELVYEYDCEGRPTVELPEDSPVRKAMSEIVKKLNI